MRYAHAVEFLGDYEPRIMMMGELGHKGLITPDMLRENFEVQINKSLKTLLEKTGLQGDIVINIDKQEYFRKKLGEELKSMEIIPM